MSSPHAPSPARALSPSRATDFLQCPLLFRLRVIDRVPERPSPAALRGTLVHAVLERLFELAPDTRTPDSALALLEPQWNRLREKQPEAAELFADEDELAAWLDGAREAIRRYFSMEDPGRLEPRERELRLEVTLESGLRLRGYVDRLDVAPDGRIRVVDYKTGKAPAKPYRDKAWLQVHFYALMVWREFGEIPTRLQLMFLGDGEWLWYEPTEADLREVEKRITDIWWQIEETARSGQWRPRKSPLCGWCDHRALCPEFGGTPPELPAGGQATVFAPLPPETAVRPDPRA
ncbi:RecB family exonuclease [Marinactinospora thermotolerans]|uniref:Putative RecB family exonuclease n=1 Tax=Marinactinospora thermotolerans DSM 45154 TaxID=1122192 RepID=A0A1T4T6Q7_9ACTN|nr:PD-(D/E)XK nuclease family protein [Marinactinospora thermotolerans]SKA35921.1 putative RecB family exonuclease [Marinactinospora thermotolerans DSM 45154]